MSSPRGGERGYSQRDGDRVKTAIVCHPEDPDVLCRETKDLDGGEGDKKVMQECHRTSRILRFAQNDIAHFSHSLHRLGRIWPRARKFFLSDIPDSSPAKNRRDQNDITEHYQNTTIERLFCLQCELHRQRFIAARFSSIDKIFRDTHHRLLIELVEENQDD